MEIIMKQLFFYAIALLFVIACSTQKGIVKIEQENDLAEEEDSVEYELIVFDPKFETWYIFQNSPANYRSQQYYEYWNRQYVTAWNYHASNSRRSSFFEPSSSVSELTYSQFLSEVESNNVINVSISGNTATGELSNNQKFSTYLPDDPELMNILRDKNINIEAKPPVELSWWMRILSSLLPMALIIGIWIFMMRQMQGGGNKVMSFGKSQAKLMGKETPKVTFEDVAGVDEAKEELQEVIEFLKNPAKFNQLGAKIPKGVLLYGPPGSGKTLLARAVAGEAGVAFFSISGSDFVEMFVGVGASRVRDLFKQAKTNNPCIIFMDEIDAVGRHRGAGLGGGHDEREQTLNQISALS